MIINFKGSCSSGGGGSKEDMVCNKNRFLTTLLAAPHLSNHSFHIREKYSDLGVFFSIICIRTNSHLCLPEDYNKFDLPFKTEVSGKYEIKMSTEFASLRKMFTTLDEGVL